LSDLAKFLEERGVVEEDVEEEDDDSPFALLQEALDLDSL
jgi:hypothetical protein